jgi:hypothetical protein
MKNVLAYTFNATGVELVHDYTFNWFPEGDFKACIKGPALSQLKRFISTAKSNFVLENYLSS